ncbi:NfeD family protein [Ekhidna sp.]|uniref:NfeD family protein n=1 Tax=Ekhidna sp. TaxID=2608089 RepID=UPI003B50A088
MEWLIIIGLMLLGTFLIVAEIIFVPGTTVVGILGFIFSAYCIYLGYDYFGPTIGTLILLGGLVLNVIALVIAFKGRSWERFSLKGTMTGKYNDDYKFDLNIGDKGMTISSLKPVGKALFEDREIEVRSNGGYINENVEIEVLRIESSKIFVQSVNN